MSEVSRGAGREADPLLTNHDEERVYLLAVIPATGGVTLLVLAPMVSMTLWPQIFIPAYLRR